MKNNSEIVNKTMCKSCLREHKEMTGHEPIDCVFKAFNNEYCEEAQELADYITNQDTKWQKLKEWLKNQITDLRRIEIKTKTQSLRVNDAVNCFREVLYKMQELVVEDE